LFFIGGQVVVLLQRLLSFRHYHYLIFLGLVQLPELVLAEEIRIAIRANHGVQTAYAQWQATADYLSKKIPEHKFILIPLENNDSLNQAVSLGLYHFSLTNPASGVEHKIRYGAKPLATLVHNRGGKGYAKFGTVIFSRSDRNDINSLKDIRGKIFMAVDELGFGGWRVAWFEFLKNKINPYSDFKELHFAGGKQQDVVYAVLNQKVAAGSVRTDTIERMALAGKINLSDFKVLGEHSSKGFPFLHSSSLYPEWMFSATKDVHDDLKTKVAKILYSIKKESVAATSGNYISWKTPSDYTSVEQLLKELKVGPYDISKLDYYSRLTSQYGNLFFLLFFIVLILTAVIVYMLKLNKQLSTAKESLKLETDFSNKLERELFHSQRIESLGQLTGGIAHDFNNMLASIIGFTELSLSTELVKKDDKLTGYLGHVITASEKCSALVNQMLTFSRTATETDKKENLSVSIFVNEVYKLLQPLLPSSYNMKIKSIDKSLFINANPVMLTQVIMNLCLNAKDAIKCEHGSITIGTEHFKFDILDVYCDSCHQDIRGEYIAIVVEDNGTGITPEIREHVFDPFFSTKEVGKGTGMGLSVVHGITHKHGGHIILNSDPGNGTAIKILLPVITSETVSTIKEESLINKTIAQGKHIVIIDDEVSLTIYLEELLSQCGFKVKSFNDSEKALTYFENHKYNIDLVILDQEMPNLSGIELSEKMFEIYNNTPIILCSGYSKDIEKEISSNSNIKAYLQKPIHSDKLLKVIESIVK
jgi:signal transduction histidine kinase/CheY-like chemotaxis protein